MKNDFNKEIEHWFADTIGKCFELSIRDNLDSVSYTGEFLNSEWGSDVLMEDRLKEYNSVPYMYSRSKRNLNLKQGHTYDPYVMWMYGYLVKHWVNKENKKPQDIWKILPLDRFNDLFGFYHTQGWNYIIADANKRYGDGVV